MKKTKTSEAGKGDLRRPSREPGTYEKNFDQIDWGMSLEDFEEYVEQPKVLRRIMAKGRRAIPEDMEWEF